MTTAVTYPRVSIPMQEERQIISIQDTTLRSQTLKILTYGNIICYVFDLAFIHWIPKIFFFIILPS